MLRSVKPEEFMTIKDEVIGVRAQYLLILELSVF